MTQIVCSEPEPESNPNPIIYKSKLINQTFEIDPNPNIGSGLAPFLSTIKTISKPITECNIFFDYNLSFNCFINFPNYLTQATFSTFFDTSDFFAKYANRTDLDDETMEIVQGVGTLDALHDDREKRIETKRVLANKCFTWMKKRLGLLGIRKNSKCAISNEIFSYFERTDSIT